MTRYFIIGGVLAAGLAAAVSAQAPRPADPAAAGSGDPLLAEVRAIRNELHQATALAIRTQVLVGRLQLQEERIHSLDRQLAQTRDELAATSQGRAAMAGPLKMLTKDADPSTADPDEAQVFAPLKQIVAAQEAREQELRQRESELLTQLAAEQARWSDFSRQLDDVERTLGVRQR